MEVKLSEACRKILQDSLEEERRLRREAISMKRDLQENEKKLQTYSKHKEQKANKIEKPVKQQQTYQRPVKREIKDITESPKVPRPKSSRPALYNSTDVQRKRENLQKQFFDNNKDLTFAPQINPNSRKLQKSARKPKQTYIPPDPMAECTFKPEIHTLINQSTTEPIEKRLIKDADMRRKRKEILEKQKEIQELTDCSFKPQVNVVDFQTKAPVFNRLTEIQQERQQKLSQLYAKYEELNKELTFKPKINPLPQTYKEIEKPIKKLYQEQELDSEYTFKPKITPYKNFSYCETFEDRLTNKTFIKKDEQKSFDNQECTFKPKINKVKVNQPAIHERIVDLQKQKEQKIQQLQLTYAESDLTFQPKINEISRAIVPKEEFQVHQAIKKEEREINYLNQFQQVHTFQPKLTKNKNWSQVKSKYSDPSKILIEIRNSQQKKQEKVNQLKQADLMKQYEDCTFNPEVYSYKKQSVDQKVPVAGLNRFLEIRNMAKRKEQDKKQREQEVFGLKGTDLGITIPKPFNITSSRFA